MHSDGFRTLLNDTQGDAEYSKDQTAPRRLAFAACRKGAASQQKGRYLAVRPLDRSLILATDNAANACANSDSASDCLEL